MKRTIGTVLILAAAVGGMVLLNRAQPGRVPPAQAQASSEVETHLEEGERIEAQYAQNTETGESAPAQPAEEAVSAEPAAEAMASVEEAAAPFSDLPAPDNAKRYLFETTKGPWVLDVYPEWAPIGAAQFHDAVEAGVYNDAGIFRVIPGFVIQFGIAADPALARTWKNKTIDDEPVRKSNKRGTITFAKSSRPNSRTTQLFISLGDNARLDQMGFSPFGEVIHGMEIVEAINAEYRERPDQGMVQNHGNKYLRKEFPNLDYIVRVSLIADTTGQ